MHVVWTKLLMTVGAIDGTSHRICRPEMKPQELHYSGHRHFHCLHTHVVCGVYGTIHYIEIGYAGHLNDAQPFGLMRQLGTELIFSEVLCLFADKIYLNRTPILTSYTASAQATCRKKKLSEIQFFNTKIQKSC